jgi:hypothetical protein
MREKNNTRETRSPRFQLESIGAAKHGRKELMKLQTEQALMLKFCKNLAGPCGAPYLPTYIPTLNGKLKKKSLDG